MAAQDPDQLRDLAWESGIAFLMNVSTDFLRMTFFIMAQASRSIEEHSSQLLFAHASDITSAGAAIRDLFEADRQSTAIRELRYILELVIKCWYVDGKFRGTVPDVPIDQRIRYLANSVPRSSISVIDGLESWILPSCGPISLASYRADAIELYSRLSAYTHVSDRQWINKQRWGRGYSPSVRNIKDLDRNIRWIRQTYDLVLFAMLNGLSALFIDDVLEALDPPLDRQHIGTMGDKYYRESHFVRTKYIGWCTRQATLRD